MASFRTTASPQRRLLTNLLFLLLLPDLQCADFAYPKPHNSLSAASPTVVSPSSTSKLVPTGWKVSAPPPPHNSHDQPHEFGAKKPVIYLYPPSRFLDVTVKLTLTPPWSFSAVYPQVQGPTKIVGDSPTAIQSVTWAVQAKADGTLKEKTTGTDVTYLYWEAE